jgi:hypothetical protein
MPVSLNKSSEPITVAHRAVGDHRVLSAVIEGDTIVGWMENSAFTVREVQPDGALAPLDLSAVALALQADDADMQAKRAGAVGISSLIAERRVLEQKPGIFLWSCVKPRSSGLRLTNFKVISWLAFSCPTKSASDAVGQHSVVASGWHAEATLTSGLKA